MLQITEQEVHLQAKAANKQAAIGLVANALAEKGIVDAAYQQGMLEREAQAVTYLGQGIAIPHGTTETRQWVKKTGIQIFQFPEGVVWGEAGERAYLVIGIAARSDEHLTLLRQLTQCLDDDNLEERLRHSTSAQEIIDNLTGQNRVNHEITAILSHTPFESLATLQAIHVSQLRQKQCVDSAYISQALSQDPAYLGQGVWLVESALGNLQNGVVISRFDPPQTENNTPVQWLMTISHVSNALEPMQDVIAEKLFQHRMADLVKAPVAELAKWLNLPLDDTLTPTPVAQVPTAESASDTMIMQKIITVRNPHGLHTRPGTHLVNLVKSFSSQVTVENLDTNSKAVNAASLMKIISLGAKQHHHLQFTAQGNDAEQVLEAIERGMANGLGESLS